MLGIFVPILLLWQLHYRNAKGSTDAQTGALYFRVVASVVKALGVHTLHCPKKGPALGQVGRNML